MNEPVQGIVWQDMRDQHTQQKLLICKNLYLIVVFGRSLIMLNQVKEIRVFYTRFISLRK